jgi:hypothetical protein
LPLTFLVSSARCALILPTQLPLLWNNAVPIFYITI